MKAKKILSCLLVALLLVSAFVGCGKKETGTTPSGSSDTSASGANEPAPAKEPEGPDYESMSMDELLELARQETGVITLYSTTTTAQLVVKKFVKAYPEFEGRVEYIESDTKTVADRIETEHDSGNINADLVLVKDNSGEIYYELVQYDYLNIFQPASICAHIDPELLHYGMPVYASYSPWYYNDEEFPDGCPIDSWWDIVEGYDTETRSFIDKAGKDHQYWTIYTKDITSASYAALWAQLIVDGDALAAQYESQYGKPLEYTYTDALQNTPGMMEFPENNGSVELFWRFTQMRITELDDGDQVVSAVDESLNGPTLGLCSGSKLDNRNNGLTVNWVTGLQPYTAFKACVYLYAVDGCDNPAGARLLTMFALGGEDGQSGCYGSFDQLGRWSVRDDVEFTKTPYVDTDVNLKSPDFEKIYAFYPNVQAYWKYWRDKAPST